jgi:carbohydrate-binding DOMON domain-containing protein
VHATLCECSLALTHKCTLWHRHKRALIGKTHSLSWSLETKNKNRNLLALFTSLQHKRKRLLTFDTNAELHQPKLARFMRFSLTQTSSHTNKQTNKQKQTKTNKQTNIQLHRLQEQRVQTSERLLQRVRPEAGSPLQKVCRCVFSACCLTRVYVS